MWQGEDLTQSGKKRKRSPNCSGGTEGIGSVQQPFHSAGGELSVQEALRRSFLSALMEQEREQFAASSVQRNDCGSFSGGAQTIQPMQPRMVVEQPSFPLQANAFNQQNLTGLTLQGSNITGNVSASLGNINPQSNFPLLSFQGNNIAGDFNPSLHNANQQELLVRAAELQAALNNPSLNMAQVLQMVGMSASALQQVIPPTATSNPPLPGTATTYAGLPTFQQATAAAVTNTAVPQDLSKQQKPSSIPCPAPNDIVLGRGKKYRQHPGNMRMHMVVDLHREAYLKASSREAKAGIKALIVNHIKNQSGDKNGRFIKLDHRTNEWIEVDDTEAQAKIGHAIRDGRSHASPQLAAAGSEASGTIETLKRNLNRGEGSTDRAEDETKILSDKEKEAARLLAGVFSSNSLSLSSVPTDDSDETSKTPPERMSTSSGTSSPDIPSE